MLSLSATLHQNYNLGPIYLGPTIMEFSMFRPGLMIHTTVCLLITSPSALAATTRYQFQESIEPAFLFVSGDIPGQVTARLSGQISVTIDDNTGAADLRFVDAMIHPVHSEEFLLEYFEEFPLLSAHGGFHSAIPGQRITSTDFKFGPSLSPGSPKYRQDFTFTAEGDSYRLNGESLFHGDDGGNYFINAVLLPVPEPPALSMLSIGVVGVSCLGRYRCGRFR
jgi:hypothetical protein